MTGQIQCYKISVQDFKKIFGEEEYWNDTEDIRCAPTCVLDVMPEDKIRHLRAVMCFDYQNIKYYKYIIAE